MHTSQSKVTGLPGSTLRLTQHALAAGENRFELLLVELQEERERVFQTIGMTLALATLVLLAGVAFTLTVVVVFWDYSRVWPITALTLLYSVGGTMLYGLLQRQLRSWQTLPETFTQVRRDLAALSTRLQ